MSLPDFKIAPSLVTPHKYMPALALSNATLLVPFDTLNLLTSRPVKS